MEATLQQLGAILLAAIPTILLLVLLYIYLKLVFFTPLQRALHRRYEATEGARKLAQQSLERATLKTAEYEAAMRAARGEIYQAQDHLHKQLQERHTAAVKAARERADGMVEAARSALAEDVETTKVSLAQQSDALANEIAESILRRSAA